MKVTRQLRANLTSLIGVVICGWSAALLCLLFPVDQGKYAVPIAFLTIIVLVAIRCGVAAGVVGSIVAALIFAYFLYQPIGSVAVANQSARQSLSWMVLGGLVLSYLLGLSGERRHN